jgi:hypothetical protein
MVFGKGDFERGVVAKILADYADNPLPYLSTEQENALKSVCSDLLRKFTELAFDDKAQLRWQEHELSIQADNLDVGKLTAADLQIDLLPVSENPF